MFSDMKTSETSGENEEEEQEDSVLLSRTRVL